MWPFKRKKAKITTKTTVPTEVQDYYESSRRERKGIAWLLGIAVLVVTILLAFLLFFGGRWLYRKATNKHTVKKPSTTQQVSSKPTAEKPKPSTTTDTNPTTTTTTTPPTPTPGTGSTPLPRTGPDLDL